jgi:WD40 repeat protein
VADGQRALSASSDNTLKLWDITTGACLCTLEGHSKAVNHLEGHSTLVNHMVVVPDGQRALSATGDRTLKLWDLTTGDCLRTFTGHSKRVESVALLPDGQRALSASDDKTLKLWDLETGECLRTFEGHSGGVRSVALLADGQRALSASLDRTLKLWELATGECLLTFYGDQPFDCCVVSVDGRMVVAGDAAGVVSFLRLEGLA